MIAYGLASVTVILVLFFASDHRALAGEAEFRLVVSANGEAVAGDFAVDLEMKISDAGQVVADDGTTAVVSMATLEGEKEYFVVVRHRNHLAAMSSTGIGLSSSAAANHDYSTGLDKYFSGEAKEIEAGVFALRAGDADASGIINAADYFVIKENVGKTSNTP